MTFEPINAHGFTTDGDHLHVKVEFIRYLPGNTEENEFNCVISCDGVHSYSNTKGLWRNGETAPEEVGTGYDLPCTDIDKPVGTVLTPKEIEGLKEGDELILLSSGRQITVVSMKKAPATVRLRDEFNTYYDAVHDSMTYYGWRLTEDRV